MSKTTWALIIKFAATLVAAGIAFGMGNSWGWIAMVALIGTAVNYLVGDLMILRAAGNIVASIADGVMAAVVAYIADLISSAFDTTWASLMIFAVIVAVAEFIFHRFLLKSEKVAP